MPNSLQPQTNFPGTVARSSPRRWVRVAATCLALACSLFGAAPVAQTAQAAPAVRGAQPATAAQVTQAASDSSSPQSIPTVVFGASGLTWERLTYQLRQAYLAADSAKTEGNTTPPAWLEGVEDFLERAALGSNVSRTTYSFACPIDGWLTLSTGVRASDERPTDGRWCYPASDLDWATSGQGTSAASATTPVAAGTQVSNWSRLLAGMEVKNVDGQAGALAPALRQRGLRLAALGEGALLALANPQGRLEGPWLRGDRDVTRWGQQLGELAATSDITFADLGEISPLSTNTVEPVNPATVDALLPERQAALMVQRLGWSLVALGQRQITARVVLVSMADTAPNANLQVAAISGQLEASAQAGKQSGERAGGQALRGHLLASGSVRRPGYIQTTDIAASLLAWYGAERPANFTGSNIYPATPATALTPVTAASAADIAPLSASARTLLAQVLAQNQQALAAKAAVPSFFVQITVILILLSAVALAWHFLSRRLERHPDRRPRWARAVGYLLGTLAWGLSALPLGLEVLIYTPWWSRADVPGAMWAFLAVFALAWALLVRGFQAALQGIRRRKTGKTSPAGGTGDATGTAKDTGAAGGTGTADATDVANATGTAGETSTAGGPGTANETDRPAGGQAAPQTCVAGGQCLPCAALAWALPLALNAALLTVLISLDSLRQGFQHFDSPLGISSLAGFRFYGNNNSVFAWYLTAALLTAGLLAFIYWQLRPSSQTADLPSAPLGPLPWGVWLVVAGLGVGVTILDGLPNFGADVGGPPALVPAFGLLALGLAGRSLRWRYWLGLGAGTVGVFALLATVDYLRPPAARSHLGRFVQTALTGDIWPTISRKIGQNLSNLVHSQLTLLTLAGVVVLLVVLRSTWRLYLPQAQRRQLRPLLIALLVGHILAYAINDSGIVLTAGGTMLLLPAALAIASDLRAQSIRP